MAKLGDQLEKMIDESMPYLFEKLSDTSALKNFGCLTVAQCALLVPSILTSKQSDDASEMSAHYIQLALLDIAHGKLSPKHPETLLLYTQYQRMAETGMFGNDGENMPLPTANWLVSLNEAKRWLQSKDIQINFDELKTELAKMADTGTEPADSLCTMPDKPIFQILYWGTEFDGDRPWMLYDSWDIELACKLIVFNYPVNLQGSGWDGLKNWHIDKWGRKAPIVLNGYFERVFNMAKSSVNGAKIREHDTPANWIEWAKDKGYDVAHLMPAEAPAAKVVAVPVTSPSGDEHDNDDGDWINKAQRIAQRLGEEQLINTGARQVTQRSICEAVVIELEKDASTHGTQGPRSKHNVRTIGLKGWKFSPPKIEKKVD